MLGKKLKILRKNKGLKQSELAVVLGVSRSQVSHYEQNAGFPSYDVLTKMSNFFGVPLDYFKDDSQINEVVQSLELNDDEFKNKVKFFLNGQQLTNDELNRMTEYIKFIRQGGA
jgi:transcriptional regulator with XRE-family HTH domain